MQIIKTSQLTGKRHTRDLDVTKEQIAKWKAGQLIQDAMPQLKPDEREFLITGITKEEWDEHFPEEED
jgi:hypothetical protein